MQKQANFYKLKDKFESEEQSESIISYEAKKLALIQSQENWLKDCLESFKLLCNSETNLEQLEKQLQETYSEITQLEDSIKAKHQVAEQLKTQISELQQKNPRPQENWESGALKENLEKELLKTKQYKHKTKENLEKLHSFKSSINELKKTCLSKELSLETTKNHLGTTQKELQSLETKLKQIQTRLPELETHKKTAASNKNFKEALQTAKLIKQLLSEKTLTSTRISEATQTLKQQQSSCQEAQQDLLLSLETLKTLKTQQSAFESTLTKQ